MHKKSTPSYGRTVNNSFHADVPYFTAPKITGQKIEDGVLYYLCGERVFIASKYNEMFTPPKGKTIKSFKGLKISAKLKFN